MPVIMEQLEQLQKKINLLESYIKEKVSRLKKYRLQKAKSNKFKALRNENYSD
jgi:chromosome segregation ATPase